MEGVVRRTAKVQSAPLGADLFERVGVLPVFRSGSDDVVGHALLEELRFRAALHRPVVPLRVESVEVEHARLAEGQAAHLALRRAGTGVVPWTDDQEMAVARGGRGVAQVV